MKNVKIIFKYCSFLSLFTFLSLSFSFSFSLNKLILMDTGYVLEEDNFLIGFTYSHFLQQKNYDTIISESQFTNNGPWIPTERKIAKNDIDLNLFSLYLNYGLKRRLEFDIGITVYNGDNLVSIEEYENSEDPPVWTPLSKLEESSTPYSIDFQLKYNFLKEGTILPSSLVKLIAIYGRSINYLSEDQFGRLLKTDLDVTLGFSFSKYIYYTILHCDIGASLNNEYKPSAVLSIGLEGKINKDSSIFIEYYYYNFHSFAKFEEADNWGVGVRYKKIQIGGSAKNVHINLIYYYDISVENENGKSNEQNKKDIIENKTGA